MKNKQKAGYSRNTKVYFHDVIFSIRFPYSERRENGKRNSISYRFYFETMNKYKFKPSFFQYPGHIGQIKKQKFDLNVDRLRIISSKNRYQWVLKSSFSSTFSIHEFGEIIQYIFNSLLKAKVNIFSCQFNFCSTHFNYKTQVNFIL